MQRPAQRALASALAAVLLAGCAANPLARAQPGMSRAQVIDAMGRPTAVVPLEGGAERLQYSQQPQGQYVTMVDLDATGRVVAAEQVMDEAHFARIEPDRWTTSDVQRAFGPPGRIDHVWSWRGDIWQYRWRQGLVDKYFWVFLDPNGVVRQAYSGTQYEDAPGESDGGGLP